MGTLYGPQSLPRVVLEERARNKSWALLFVAPTSEKKEKFAHLSESTSKVRFYKAGTLRWLCHGCGSPCLFMYFTPTAAGGDVAAVFHQDHGSNTVCGGVRQTHWWVYGAVSKRSNCASQSRYVLYQWVLRLLSDLLFTCSVKEMLAKECVLNGFIYCQWKELRFLLAETVFWKGFWAFYRNISPLLLFSFK